MGQVAYRRTNPFLTRCDRCHKLSKQFYRMSIGNFNYNFCGGMCAEAARGEYEKKEKLGITPSNLTPIVDETMEERGSIIDSESY